MGDDISQGTAVEHSDRSTTPVDTKPEYVDFDVDDFPGGLPSCLEAMLMAADQPQHSKELAKVLSVDEQRVVEALQALRAEYEGSGTNRIRGFELRQGARGWQFCSRAQFESVVSAFVTDGQSAKLSQAALEALAIIAYKQPITRAQVAAIRGVNSDGVIRTLSIRGLIQEDGIDSVSRAALLVTSPSFLDHMGIARLSDLPSLAPFLPQAESMIETGDEERGAESGFSAQA
jgi:segregation and condensation protein B